MKFLIVPLSIGVQGWLTSYQRFSGLEACLELFMMSLKIGCRIMCNHGRYTVGFERAHAEAFGEVFRVMK
jgi:hypothetical protein